MNPKITNLKEIATLRRYTVSEGREKGLDVIDCDNGKLRFLVNVTRAFDIMQLYHEGQNVSYLSKNAFSPREHTFANRFEGGMLYTCGFDAVGGRKGYIPHGSFHLNLAEVITSRCDEDGIYLEAEVRQTGIFKENLVLRRRISTALGSDTLTVEDTLTNEGYTPAEYAILYHVNVGYPMLDSGARLRCNVNSVTPRTEYASGFTDKAFEIEEPIAGRPEMCYYLDIKDGEISLENPENRKTFNLKYSKETLPNFLEWKAMTSGDYALGLEPATTKLDDNLSFNVIEAGEKINFKLEMRVF